MFQTLRNRNIALLFGGQIISIAGDLVLFIALPFWVYQLTGSVLATGLMFAALTIPQLLFSPLAGVFVDRLDRKRLMIFSDLLRAALMLCYLVVTTADQVWVIYLLAFAESAVSQFFRPAVMAVVPTLVEGEQELTRANAALSASWAVGQLVGPALGGALVAAFGPHSAALFDGATYLVSAGMILFLRVPPRAVMAAASAEATRHVVAQIADELREGIAVVLGRPVLRVTLASLGVFFLSQGIINVLLVVMVKQIWHVGATEFGWFVSVEGLGGILGTLVVGALAARVAPKRLVVGGGLVAGLIILAIVNQPSIYVGMVLILFGAMTFVAFDVGLTTLLQLGSDDTNRGRVSGLMHTVIAASQLTAIAATSLVADHVSVVVMLDAAALLFSAGGLVAVLVPRIETPAPLTGAIPQPAD